LRGGLRLNLVIAIDFTGITEIIIRKLRIIFRYLLHMKSILKIKKRKKENKIKNKIKLFFIINSQQLKSTSPNFSTCHSIRWNNESVSASPHFSW